VTAGTKSPRVFYAICRVLAGLVFCGHVALGGVRLFEPSPSDLELTAAEEAQSSALSHFGAGLLYALDESPDAGAAAERHLLQALRFAPQSPLAAEALIYPYLMRRDFLGVVALLKPIAEAHPDGANLVLLMAEAYEAAEQPEAAIQCLEKGLADGRWSSGRIVRHLFALLWQQKRYDEGEKLLRRAGRKKSLRDTFDYQYAAAIHGNVAAVRDARDGKSPRHLDRLRTESLAHARAAAKLAATDVEPREVGALADLLIDAGCWEDARTMLERLADEYDAPDLWLLKARALLRCHQAEQAGAYLQELITHYLPEEYFREATELLTAATDRATAARVFRHYLALQPDSIAARYQLAYLYYASEQPALGLEALEPIRDQSPECLLLRAYLHHHLQQTDLALADVEQARALAQASDRNDFLTADFHLFVSSLYEERGDTRAAIEAARQALALAPDDPGCANCVGYLLADSNQELAAAEQLIRQAVAASPDNAAYQDSLAWVLYRQGRFSPALAAMFQALALDDEADAVLFDHAGDICAALQLGELASFYWAQALAAGIAEPDAVRRKLAGLDNVDSGASTRYVP